MSYLPGPLNAVKDSLADKAIGGEERRSRSFLARSRDDGYAAGARAMLWTPQGRSADRAKVVHSCRVCLQPYGRKWAVHVGLEAHEFSRHRNFHRQLEAEVRAKFAPFARRFNFQRTLALLAGKDLKVRLSAHLTLVPHRRVCVPSRRLWFELPHPAAGSPASAIASRRTGAHTRGAADLGRVSPWLRDAAGLIHAFSLSLAKLWPS